MARNETLNHVSDTIHKSQVELAGVNAIPADGLTIDAAALIHRKMVKSMNNLMDMQRTITMLREHATDF